MKSAVILAVLGMLVVNGVTTAANSDDVGLKYLSHQLANPTTKNAGERGISLAIDEQGNFYMTGTLQQAGRFGDTILECTGTNSSPCRDLFVAKYDRQRKLVWLRHAPDASGRAIACQQTDSIVVGGATYGATRIAEQEFPHSKKPNAFFARYNLDGQAAWARSLSSTGACEIHGVATEPNGHILVTGVFSGLADFGGSSLSSRGQRDGFLAKYTEDGKLVWVRQHGDDITTPGNVAIDKHGNAYVAGTFWDSSDGAKTGVYLLNSSIGFKTGAYLIKYAPDGNVIWTSHADSDVEPTHRRYSEGLTGQNVVVDREGNPHITGTFHGTRRFGSFTITNEIIIRRFPTVAYTNENKTSLFFAKYTADGTLEWVRQRRDGDGKFAGAVPLASATTLPISAVSATANAANHASGLKKLSSQAATVAASVPGSALMLEPNGTGTSAVSPLRIFKAGANVVLVWPATSKERVLESTDTLTPFPIWTAVSAAPTAEGSFVTVILPAQDAAKFYRLRVP